MAIAGLVIGILALVLGGPVGFTGYTAYVGLVLAIVGVVLSALANKKQKSGVAIAGLVISIIALVLSAIFSIACGICICIAAGAADALTYLPVAIL